MLVSEGPTFHTEHLWTYPWQVFLITPHPGYNDYHTRDTFVMLRSTVTYKSALYFRK